MDTTKHRAFSAILLWSLSLNAGVKESPSEDSEKHSFKPGTKIERGTNW